MNNDAVKNIKINTLKTMVNNLEKKLPDATTLIHINQYNTDTQILERKSKLFIKNIRYESFSDYSC